MNPIHNSTKISLSPTHQADQICYAVLCVFSYVAAGRQDQKKDVATGGHAKKQVITEQRVAPATTTSAVSTPPKSPVIGLHQTSPLEKLTLQTTLVQPPEKAKSPTVPQTVENISSPVAKPVNQQVPTKSPSPPNSAELPQTNPFKVSSPPKEPPPVGPSASAENTTKPLGNLPQVPPRVQSQGSVTRGPPPAIPPRPQAILQRAGTVQTQSKPNMNRTLTRQQSASSVPPQFTPQPPPKFVIPQRQNSKASLTRQQSSTSSGGASPQSPKKH